MSQSDTASVRSVLQEIARLKGVGFVVLLGPEGEVIETVSGEGGEVDAGALSSVALSSLAAGGALAEFFGEGEPLQMIIEFERGPVLVASLGGERAWSLCLTLDSAGNLGRVRFGLRRPLAALAALAGA